MAGIAEGVVDEEVRQLKAELERQLERTRVFLEKAIKEGRYDRSVEAARATAAEVADILARNFDSVNAGFEAASERVQQATLSDLANAGVTASFSAVSAASLRAQVDGTLSDITTIAGEAARELRDVIVDIVRSNVPPTEAIKQLTGVVGARTGEVATLIDTGLAAFDREVSVVAASEAGVEWFLYDGPLDQLTRPYCDARVGKRFTIAKLDATENDTGPNPPSRYCGGYNCRHRLVALVRPEDVAAYPEG